MQRTTSSITFFCRKSKANKKGFAPVECSIIINQQRRFINLPVKFRPEDFNKKRQTPEITETLDAWRTKINLFQVEMLKHNIPLTVENLRETIQTGGVKSYYIENLFEDYLNILNLRIGKDLSKGVYRKYELVKELFFTHINPKQECTAITNSVIRTFYAKLNAKYDSSTSAGYMTKLKAFIQFGMDNAKIDINPFQGIKIVKGQKDITFLTEKEIQVLIDAKMENQSLQRALDCFLIMAGSGLAYCDLKALRPEDIQEKSGVHYIRKQRVKNGQNYTAVILPFAWERLEKYECKPPVISNQKTNSYLSTITDILSYPKSLHCHLARHTYATLLLNKVDSSGAHIPMKVISTCLGHSNTKITESTYAKLLDTTVIDTVSKLF